MFGLKSIAERFAHNEQHKSIIDWLARLTKFARGEWDCASDADNVVGCVAKELLEANQLRQRSSVVMSELRQLFREADVDDSGALSIDEITEAVRVFYR